MIKVIIVDDEEMTREGLKEYVSWSSLGMKVVATAEDGNEALAKIEELQPELLICDVRMPHMDGLELARQLKEHSYGCKILFMSGYSDVEYLRTAIKLQAIDYIEKPVQIAELEELLSCAGEEIRATLAERKQVKKLKERWDQHKPELSSSIIQRLIELPASQQAFAELKEEIQLLNSDFPLAAQWTCAAVALRNDADRSRWHQEAMDTAQDLDIPIIAAVLDRIGVAIMAHESDRNRESISLWANRQVHAKDREVDKRAVGIGDAVHTMMGIKGSYQQSLKALQFHFYRGWNSILWYREIPQETQRTILFDQEQLANYEEALQLQKYCEVEDILNRALQETVQYPMKDIERVRQKLFRWYMVMTKVHPEAMWEFDNDELWSTVFMEGDLFIIRQFIMKRLAIIRESREKSVSNEKSVIREAARFMEQNYAEDILISDIASHVYLTPTYLCLLFKKERGVSINEYLTQVRIEAAKRLLNERKLKLYEISQKVGYRDPNYFAKVFRKVMGSNPSQYRERNGDLYR